jgi:Cu+-exporting ATPase
VAARAGILIRDAEALERACSLDTVVFDKTGTLTEGRPVVERVTSLAEDRDDDALLALAAAVQRGSEHPLGRAIVRAAQDRELDVPAARDFRALAGRGIEARVDDATVAVGSRRLMGDLDVDMGRLGRSDSDGATGDGSDDDARALERAGFTVVWVARDGVLAGSIALGDRPRDTAAAAIARLRAAGVHPMIMTGDNAATAERIARDLNVDDVLADVLPEDKAAHVGRLGADRRVGMVGDGINDAPALAAATVGFAMGTGTDVAMETAGVTLMRPEPTLVADAIDVSRATVRKIHQNLFWAFFYNVVGIPLAAFGLLTPMIAGGAMALSSVSVVSNALLLYRWKPQDPRD